jgi:outer membrane biogenesis lipoprotein LolB
MDMSRSIRPLLLALCLLVFAACAGAQSQPNSQGFEPRVGQQGKDVVWVRRLKSWSTRCSIWPK